MNSHARNWSSAWLALRSLLWTILLPGVFAGYVPWRFFGLGRTQFDLTSPTQLLGFVCIGLGVALLAACIFEFARSGQGTLSPVDPPRHLVVRGLYRYLRNPMYLSVTMIILGEALVAHSVALAFYWLRVGLSARSVPGVVGHCCARNYRSDADRREDAGND